jgi:hypothetical protein
MNRSYQYMLMIVVALGSDATTRATGSEKEGNWKPHQIQRFTDQVNKLPAKLQIVSLAWNRVAAVPYIVYMPEKDRLAMLIVCDSPHHAFLLFSDDHGATWTEPKRANPEMDIWGVGLAYLGDGQLMFTTVSNTAWFSDDYGHTWPRSSHKPGPAHEWDPPLVDRDPNTGKIIHILSTAYRNNNQAFTRTSSNMGQTWGANIDVPQWHGYNEVALVRAANGDIVAACRTEPPERFRGQIDHYEGLGVSLSKDNGQTWSDVVSLYEYGRHHPSMVVLPNGDIVMTYVVRLGYPNDPEGFQQFGIEAVVSHDHGASWDMDRRYVLHKWSANRKDRRAWWASSQATSTLLLPTGDLLTAFGTGYRSPSDAGAKAYSPRDVGLIQWHVSSRP